MARSSFVQSLALSFPFSPSSVFQSLWHHQSGSRLSCLPRVPSVKCIFGSKVTQIHPEFSLEKLQMMHLLPRISAELLEIVSTPPLPNLHCPWSKPPSSLGIHHELLELASSLLQALLHTTTTLCVIHANQSVSPLLKPQQRLAFILGTKSRILTLTYRTFVIWFFPTHHLSRAFVSTLSSLQPHWTFLSFHTRSLPDCSSCVSPQGGL